MKIVNENFILCRKTSNMPYDFAIEVPERFTETKELLKFAVQIIQFFPSLLVRYQAMAQITFGDKFLKSFIVFHQMNLILECKAQSL